LRESEELALAGPVLDTGYLIRGREGRGNVKGINAFVRVDMENQSHIRVKVIPRSSRNQIIKRAGEVVTVKLAASPVEGAANKALVTLLAEKLGLPKGNIDIVSGKGSRLKLLRVRGLSLSEIDSLLSP
jgi:uncharacterized protein (TIGR00251 family)